MLTCSHEPPSFAGRYVVEVADDARVHGRRGSRHRARSRAISPGTDHRSLAGSADLRCATEEVKVVYTQAAANDLVDAYEYLIGRDDIIAAQRVDAAIAHITTGANEAPDLALAATGRGCRVGFLMGPVSPSLFGGGAALTRSTARVPSGTACEAMFDPDARDAPRRLPLSPLLGARPPDAGSRTDLGRTPAGL
jgi:hypothetical protein